MNAGYVIVGGVVVVLFAIPAAWLLVLRLLNDDGFEIVAAAGEPASVRGLSAEWPREREQHLAMSKGLDQAKDRAAARTWDPER